MRSLTAHCAMNYRITLGVNVPSSAGYGWRRVRHTVLGEFAAMGKNPIETDHARAVETLRVGW